MLIYFYNLSPDYIDAINNLHIILLTSSLNSRTDFKITDISIESN